MKSLLMLALLSSFTATVHAVDPGAPSAELLTLEQAIIQSQDDWKKGAVAAEQHQISLAGFRGDLPKALAKSPPSPANIAVHSRILALLGDRDAAVQDLKWTSPGETALALSIGQTYYEEANYAAALDVATKILEREPKNDAALFLKHSSTGRVVPNSAARTEVAAQAPAARVVRADVVFSAPSKQKAVTEIPFTSNNESSPSKNNPWPIWPLLPVAGLGAGVYAVSKSRRTVESEEGFNADDRPQPGELQRFVAGSILSGLAAAALYLGGGYVLSVGAPFASRFMATGPGQVKAASELPKASARAVPIANEVPRMLARVVPLKEGQAEPVMLGRVGDPHVFVTAAEDIAGIAPGQIAARLGIAPAQRFLIVKFPAPSTDIRTPTRFDNPLFLGRGVTSGGAREFQITNMRIPETAAKEIVEVNAMSR